MQNFLKKSLVDSHEEFLKLLQESQEIFLRRFLKQVMKKSVKEFLMESFGGISERIPGKFLMEF